LTCGDYEVVTASGGEEALEQTASTRPDLIVLDIEMPGMDGGQVAAALSKNKATSEIPILFLTGLVKKGEQSPGMKSGKHSVLAKPVGVEEFLHKVSAILALSA
jgi:CheY-like chemotaxis protein